MKINNNPLTWQDAKDNSDVLTDAIENILKIKSPKNISDVLAAVKKVDNLTSCLPNPNQEGQYCQLIIYPSKKWHTWSSTSMSISKYNLFY